MSDDNDLPERAAELGLHGLVLEFDQVSSSARSPSCSPTWR